MKNIIISGVVTALLLLTGCSDKDPVVEPTDEASSSKAFDASSSDSTIVDSGQNGVVEGQDSVSSSSYSNGSNGGQGSDIASLEAKFDTVYFDFDKFVIRTDQKNKVPASAAVANGVASALTVKLEGNCDEWGSDEYNFALGLKRANTVKKAMVAEGVDANRITMVSYGESNPTCTNKTRDCWAQNRRVDFKLLP